MIIVMRKDLRVSAINLIIPLSVLGTIVIIVFFGCSSQDITNDLLNIPEELITSPSEEAVIAVAVPSVATSPSSLLDNYSNDNYGELCLLCPMPQIVEVPVEVVVELPGKTVEIVKEVFLDTPLDGMDMRRRQLEFLDELNAKYLSVFDLKIGGGDYSYNFTSKTEFLTNYHFIAADGKRMPCFIPLSLNADQFTIDMIKAEIRKGA
jgi:hypothetical protein